MKTIVNENLAISAGTRAMAECLASLNNNYEVTVKALNVAFGSNEVSAQMLMKQYIPAFLELQKVIKGFIAESVTRKLDGDEMETIEEI